MAAAGTALALYYYNSRRGSLCAAGSGGSAALLETHQSVHSAPNSFLEDLYFLAEGLRCAGGWNEAGRLASPLSLSLSQPPLLPVDTNRFGPPPPPPSTAPTAPPHALHTTAGTRTARPWAPGVPQTCSSVWPTSAARCVQWCAVGGRVGLCVLKLPNPATFLMSRCLPAHPTRPACLPAAGPPRAPCGRHRSAGAPLRPRPGAAPVARRAGACVCVYVRVCCRRPPAAQLHSGGGRGAAWELDASGCSTLCPLTRSFDSAASAG